MSGALRDAIVAKIRTAIPALETVEGHPGSVTPATFKKWVTCSPGVFVVCLGAERVTNLGGPYVPWRFAAFIVTRCQPECTGSDISGDADRAAMSIAARLMATLHNGNFGEAASPVDIKANNQSTPQLAQLAGANLWVVTWTQSACLTAEELAASDRYIANPRPLTGVNTDIDHRGPPPEGESALVTDQVDFPTP